MTTFTTEDREAVMKLNPKELADRLEQGHWEGGIREQAAAMLRKQEEDIQELQRLFDKAMDEWSKEKK